MKINFLTTEISNKTGGAAYDEQFYRILCKVYPKVNVYDDNYFLGGKKAGFLKFCQIYSDCQDMLFDADYLIVNSRLYTRFLWIDKQTIKKKYPNLKIIIIHHHNDYMSHAGIKKFIHKKLELKMLRMAYELVVPNQYVAEELRVGHKIFNIVFLKTALDKRKYKTSRLNSKIVLFVGNVQQRKGLALGIRAFRYLYEKDHNYKFVIAGDYKKKDKYYKNLCRLIRRQNMERAITFLGRVDDGELDRLYASAELFLYPSLLEGYGLVIMEAMGRGVPVICFNNSAMPYTVKSGYNGIVVRNKDVKKMGMALVGLALNRKRKRKYQAGALATYHCAHSKAQLEQDMYAYMKEWD